MPCASAAPGLVQTYEKYKSEDVVFVGLTAEGEGAKAVTEAFLKRFGITWPTGYGAGKTIEAFRVTAYPTVLVIGTDGKVAWNDWLGGKLDEEIEKALRARSS